MVNNTEDYGEDMFEPEKIDQMLRAEINVSHLDIIDLTGTRDHYSVVIVSEDFKGTMPLSQHRRVNAALAQPLASGEIHALQLKTLTPDEWENAK